MYCSRSEKEKRARLSEEFKHLGNKSFQDEKFTEAEELYTSAILQSDENPLLFTNRAQARIKLRRFNDAIDDCKMALKLNPGSVKVVCVQYSLSVE